MDNINIQIVYATPERQTILDMTVDKPCTVEQAIAHSTLLADYPEVDFSKMTVGIWGKRVPHNNLCAEGDRIEIYRPLIIDPKQARKKRV